MVRGPAKKATGASKRPGSRKKADANSPTKSEYERKRDFSRTPEPQANAEGEHSGGAPAASGVLRFVVQRHDATRLHFDLRLEIDGALLSFALPRGFPEEATEKRLAVETEDHPLRYTEFEGTIPDGNYGAGDMTIWDVGSYECLDRTPKEAREKGHFHLRFHGGKLRTDYHLVRTKGKDAKDGATTLTSKQWLLFFADPKGVLKKRAEALALVREKGDVARATTLPVANEADYLFEIKYDGYRLLASKANGEVALVTRNGLDWTERFSMIARALRELPAPRFVIDGEACVVDDRGIPRFEHLQRWLSGERSHGKLAFVAFDVLHDGDVDTRKEPLEERKSRLARLFGTAKAPLSLASTVPPPLASAMAAAEGAGLEGLIAKKKGSAYVGGISSHWLKVKFSKRQEFVVVGWTPLERTSDIGALLLATYENGRFVYAGKVGTGFDADDQKRLKASLLGIETSRPFAEGMPHIAEATFVAPVRVVEVRFAEWLSSGVIRHASYLGLREDRRPEECVRESHGKTGAIERTGASNVDEAARLGESEENRSAPSVPIRFTNLDKILYPKDGFAKRDVIAYYDRVSAVMLPHLSRRPVHLQRWPDGIHEKEWYQHRVPPNPPTFVRRLPFEDGERVIVENKETLLWLANLAALSLHTWSSRAPARVRNEVELDEALGTPDYAVIDLDPQGEQPKDWENLIQIASAIRALLETLELVSVVKTTGNRGLHIVIPLRPPVTHLESGAFAREITRAVARVLPDIATNELSKAKRHGRVLVDLAPNGRGKTMIAPYSLRAVDGARASCPILWSEVTTSLRPDDFNLRTLPARIEKFGDLFLPALGPGGIVPKRE